MEYKDSYEFVKASGCWEEGGEYYDGDILVRSVSLFEDENGRRLYYDDRYDEWRHTYTVDIDGVEYTDIKFGPASGYMFGRQSRMVFVVVDCPPANGFDCKVVPIGFVDYYVGSDNAKSYWDFAELIIANYEKAIRV